MNTNKTTDLLEGYFDVKIYQDGKPREQWRMKADDDNITFSFITREAGEFSQFAKQFTNKDGEQMHRVTFKIGRNCHWYNERAEQVERPSSAELDGKRFRVKMVYRALLPDPNNDKSPRGYWASAIMFKECQSNPFMPMDEVGGFQQPQQPQPQQQPQQQPPQNVQAFFDALENKEGEQGLPY